MKVVIMGCLLAAALPGFACDYPDEGGMPLRRAVTKVQLLPEVDAWARAMQKNGVTPQYLVRVDEPVYGSGREAGSCWWPVEVRAEGKLWRSYLITPDGKRILSKKQD
jgi:hypothetical protein